jgi:hypothetical protein
VSPILGVFASANQGQFISYPAFESIATVTVGAGGASTIDFTSIPSTYQHLQIRGIGRNTRAGATEDRANIRFNSDTGSNYAFHGLYGNGSSALTDALSSRTSCEYVFVFTAAAAAANTFGAAVVDILDYANTNKNKTLRSLNGYDLNGSGSIYLTSGLWQNTAAITSISIIPANGTFPQYTSYALYGIKGN